MGDVADEIPLHCQSPNYTTKTLEQFLQLQAIAIDIKELAGSRSSSSSLRVFDSTSCKPFNDDMINEDVEFNPQDAWLPITESRAGNVFSVVFHLLSSGIGFQALLLPAGFAALGWTWGSICLLVAFVWQLYTTWLLVQLPEAVPGTRHSRYLHLAIASFGPKLGKLLALFPTMYLSGGSCVMLIITGSWDIEQFFNIVCEGRGATCQPKSIPGVVWFLMFTCIAIAIAQLPNLHSVAKVSAIGAITVVGYCTIVWTLSVNKGRVNGVSYQPPASAESDMAKFSDILNGIGVIMLAFRGHNVIVEIQGTLPASKKNPPSEQMWRGVTISYLVIAMVLFPLAIAGFWAYGNKVPPANGGILGVFWQTHGNDTSEYVMATIFLLAAISSICSFQIYAMPVFDNLELRYVVKKNQRCPLWVRTAFRLFFGCLAFFIALTFPFLGSLAAIIGGIALPLTYVYPCFMWISIKKPPRCSGMWWFNLGLGCLGVALSVMLVVAAVWSTADKGLNANFFRPK